MSDVRACCACRQSEEMCKRFEPLAEQVSSVFPEMQPDGRELSELTGNILMFMEEHLGREVLEAPRVGLLGFVIRTLGVRHTGRRTTHMASKSMNRCTRMHKKIFYVIEQRRV